MHIFLSIHDYIFSPNRDYFYSFYTTEILFVLLYLSGAIQMLFVLASSPNFSDRKGSKSHVGAYLHVLNAGFLFASMA